LTFPAFGLDVSGLPCLVVGGGRVGGRRALLLAENGAKVTVLSPEIAKPVREAVADGCIQWRCGEYHCDALEGFRLVVAATPDAELNRRIGQDAEVRGILFCITSAGQVSRVIFPAIYEYQGATIAVHSNGQSPQRSIRIRDAVAKALAGDQQGERQPYASVLQDGRTSPSPGKVYLVGAGPGAADLITVRGLRAIQSAAVVIYDRILGQAFLEKLDIRHSDRVVEWLGASQRGPERQIAINQKMLEATRAGRVVARIKNGDAFVFGRGAEEVRFLVANGIPFEVVPGLTSATGVPSAAGYPLTCRAEGRSFSVTSARVAGGGFNEVYPKADSLVVLMAVGLVDRVVARLIEDGWPPDTPATMIERGTLPEERRLAGPLSRIADLVREARIVSPAVLVVGEAAANPISDL